MRTKLLIFEELSSVLTGFSLADIQGAGISSTYLEFLENRDPEVPINELMQAFENLNLNIEKLSNSDLSLIGAILEDDYLGAMSQQLIMMWYTGQWNFNQDDTFVITANAYIESFSFIAAGSHPQGAKQPGFGTWQYPPNTFPEV